MRIRADKASMELGVGKLLDDFAQDPARARKALRNLAESAPGAFFQQSLPLLRTMPSDPGFQYLLAILLSRDLILESICDPELFTCEQSIALSRKLAQLDPGFKIKLTKMIMDGECESPGIAERPARLRFLEIMAAFPDTSPGALLSRFLRHRDSRIRSKATLLLGKTNKNSSWVLTQLNDPDARIRANAVESLWSAHGESPRAVYWAALSDPDNRVVGNALVGLYRLGDPTSIALLAGMLEHAETDFQLTAIWAIGETEDPRFHSLLQKLLRTAEPATRGRILRALSKITLRRARMAGQSLQLQVAPMQAESGFRACRVAVRGSNGNPISGLKPTQFAIWENGILASDFDVQFQPRNTPVAVAFALPDEDAQTPIYDNALRICNSQRAPADRWLILRYQDGAETAPGPSLEPTEALQPDFIHRRPAAGKPPNITRAMEVLIGSVSGAKGSRHVVVLHRPSDKQANPVAPLPAMDAARANNITIHVIAESEHPVLRQLATGTGGAFLAAADPMQRGQLLQDLYATLNESYSIKYCKPEAAAREVSIKLEVYSDEGLAEKTFPG